MAAGQRAFSRTLQKDSKVYYRVGLIGHDVQAKHYQWGDDGMLGKERKSETETDFYRNILVQPRGAEQGGQ